MIGEKLGGALLDGVAALDEAAPLGQHKTEHPDRIRVWRNRQTHGSL
jgi:hypothetical protein